MSNYQNDFTNDLATQTFGEQPEKSWFGRNWLWFLPLVVLAPILCCCGGFGSLMWLGMSTLKNETPYKDSFAAAQQHPEVQAALGTPIELGGFMGIPTDGSEPDYQPDYYMIINIPIKGPNGTATIYVDASKYDGVNWVYNTQEVVLPDGTVIDLTTSGSSLNGEEARDVFDDASDAVTE